MKGKPEFPPDVPASGDVLSHLSKWFEVFINLTNFEVFYIKGCWHKKNI